VKAWDIDELRRGCKGRWILRGSRAFNGKIATDSRKAGEGDLFIAIKGERHDAHQYLEQVFAAKVAAVLVHAELTPAQHAAATANGCAVIAVEETIAGLNRLASAYRETVRAKVIAVGGSNGKTTTKRIIDALLAEKYRGVASPKSFNNNIGMPLTLLSVEPSHEYAVLEIGTNAPGEIAALGAVCRPDIALITSIGLEHLEKLKDIEGVAGEEASIASYITANGTLILPAEASELLLALKAAKVQKILIGREKADGKRSKSDETVDLVATGIETSRHGTRFGINGRGAYTVPLLGEHNASNALMAIAVARRLGLSEDQIISGLAKVKPADMRLELMQIGPYAIINDAYNANPTSMEAALKVLAGMKDAPRRVAILGDMLELGDLSPAMHKHIGTLVASLGIERFIAVGPMMAEAAHVARAAGVNVTHFADSTTAGHNIAGLVETTDALLLKGSRGSAMEKILVGLGHTVPAHAH